MALKTKFAPFLISVSRKAVTGFVDDGSGYMSTTAKWRGGRDRDFRVRLSRARESRARLSRTRESRITRKSLGARVGAGRGRGYVAGELFCVGLYGWLEFRNTVYTLSTLLSFSKNGIKSNSSESVMSSNHDATGTWKVNNFI